jgi:hypothetical protein
MMIAAMGSLKEGGGKGIEGEGWPAMGSLLSGLGNRTRNSLARLASGQPGKPHWTREGAIRGPFKLGDSERGQSRSGSKLTGAVSEAP